MTAAAVKGSGRTRSVVLVITIVVVLVGFALTALRLRGTTVTQSSIPPPPAGWHLTFSDSFSGTQLDASNWWGRYSGIPGGDPKGYWLPSHVLLQDGYLVLRTYRDKTPDGERWVSGGIGQRDRRAQEYGKYLVRMRVAPGQGISTIALLFPLKGWPPEIDFYEDAPTGETRDALAGTLHYDTPQDQIQRFLSGVNFTNWHTLGVIWSPGELRYTLDGRVWATVRSDHVPSQPMTLDLQSQALTCSVVNGSCPGAGTPKEVDTDIDWVAVYAHSA